MRLGQLARKLSLRPSQVVDFLAASNIESAEGSNTRLDDNHVVQIVQHFSPERLGEILRTKSPEEIILETRVEEMPVDVAVVPVVQEEVNQHVSDELQTELLETVPADSEVIRVQKVELAGLKVLGKIELPEPKKKEAPLTDKTAANDKPENKERSLKNRDKQNQRNREQRTRRNPVEVQRQREQHELEEKRKIELEREKEKRKQHYHNKVKQVTQQPVKRAKLVNKTSVRATSAKTQPVPKTWIGKFLRWWTT